MLPTDDLLRRTANFVSDLLKKKLPSWAVYHDYGHTVDIVRASREIGKGSKLNDSELQIVSLAAWFHDTGYTETHNGHEKKSVEIASRFLKQSSFPREKIRQVSSCILATKVPQQPKNLLEQILCDADMVYLGKSNFVETNNLLKKEIEKRERIHISDHKWLGRSVDFALKHRFHTAYARNTFRRQQRKNVLRLRRLLQQVISKDDEGKSKKGVQRKTKARKARRK